MANALSNFNSLHSESRNPPLGTILFKHLTDLPALCCTSFAPKKPAPDLATIE
jgi:hypothetical protein